MSLFSNRSQMTSKCGKNKKVAHEAIVEYVTNVLTTFWRLLWSITEQTHGNMESICWSDRKMRVHVISFVIAELSLPAWKKEARNIQAIE